MKILRLIVFSFMVLTLSGCSSENSKWEETLKINTITGYKNYIKSYPEGKFLKASSDSIESLEWVAAFSSKSDSLLQDCIVKYPESRKVDDAKDLQSQIKWPVIELNKADCIEIYDNGIVHSLGLHFYNYDGWDNIEYINDSQIPKTIVVIRSFSDYDLMTKKNLRLIKGVAYLKLKDGYRYIKKVDLSKSDKELADEFGINY